MLQIVIVAGRSGSANQLVPPFVVFHTPPPIVPTHIVFGVVGWISTERFRPPMLPGPRKIQFEGPVAAFGFAARSASRCSFIRQSAFVGIVPPSESRCAARNCAACGRAPSRSFASSPLQSAKCEPPTSRADATSR